METFKPSVEDLVNRAKSAEKVVALDLINKVPKIDGRQLIPDSSKRKPQPPENS